MYSYQYVRYGIYLMWFGKLTLTTVVSQWRLYTRPSARAHLADSSRARGIYTSAPMCTLVYSVAVANAAPHEEMDPLKTVSVVNLCAIN